jgi:N-acetylneuraminate synthase/N,N'-diacetyllegionaminate synthase
MTKPVKTNERWQMLTVVGADRPGIVAKLTKALFRGGCNLGEVERALAVIAEAGNPSVLLLHCTTAYPTPPEQVNLRAMLTLRDPFGLDVGLSDHSQGNEVAFAAVGLGACVIEKHFTLDRAMAGPDHKASLEPDELKRMVGEIRTVESCLGDGIKRMAPSEADTANVARKSIVAARDLPAGAVLDRNSVTVKRPGTGLPPAFLEFVLGRRLRKPVQADGLIEMNSLE